MDNGDIKNKIKDSLIKRSLGYKYKETTKERISGADLQRKRHNGDFYFELTEKDWEVALNHFNYECAYCGSSGALTKDHVIPLVKGGKFSRENIVPCCQSCNSSKKDNDFEEWYRKTRFYSSVRETKIKDYLKLMEGKTSEIVQNLNELSDDQALIVTKEIEKEVFPDISAQVYLIENGLLNKNMKLNLYSPEDIRISLIEVGNMLVNNEIDAKRAAAFTRVCDGILKSIQIEQYEKRRQKADEQKTGGK